MIAMIIALLITFILRLILRRQKQKQKNFFMMEIILFTAATLLFGGRIVYSAIPYHGELSWKLDEWKRKKEVTLEHNNFFEDGVEGILNDLNESLNLPEKLYIANKFQLTFEEDGTIQTIYAFLYGKDEKGETKTYLVNYDGDKSQDMSVWINGEANGDYDNDMSLDPMLQILEKADCEKQVKEWAAYTESGIYGILYYGKRSFQTEEGLVYLSGNAGGYDIDTSIQEVEGFEVSLYIPASEEITPVRYMIDPIFISQEELEEEWQAQQEELEKEWQAQQQEEAKNAESWTIDQTNGTMYFFLDEKIGWRLVVTDAAAGSRFYGMEGTTDGGTTWSSVNDDPFLQSIGVTEGLLFFDKDFGFAGLASGSQSYSSIFVTRDGGVTFERVQLPMDTVSQLPDLAVECGFTVDDYDYFSMPEKENDVLTIKALTEAGEKEGILFQSRDDGETWEYAGITSE
jgi:hypothetical protein